jgi:hypothetical protein
LTNINQSIKNKMKTIQSKIVIFIAVIFATATLLSSCSKDEDPAPAPTPTATVYQAEDFLASFLSQANFPAPAASIDEQLVQRRALVFKPTVTGEISKFKLKLPKTGVFEVTLWDSTTRTSIMSEDVIITNPLNTYVVSITPTIKLEKNKEYAISYKSNHQFAYEKTTNLNYPIVCGNITIIKSISGVTTGYPDTNLISNKTYNGDCSFVFTRTE